MKTASFGEWEKADSPSSIQDGNSASAVVAML
jgi:hypothetical protein